MKYVLFQLTGISDLVCMHYFSKWELLICDNCGSQGGHVGCHHLVKKGKDYICPECHEVDLKCKYS